jgi:hypothetical protein
MNLVQLQSSGRPAVALVDEPRLRLIDGVESVYELAMAALAKGASMLDLVRERVSDVTLDYDDVEQRRSGWRLAVPIHHPVDPARCLVSGTGLTHFGSAANRDAMHAAGATLTDSMRMFQSGVAGGRPAPRAVGTAPEWFYKGTGTSLRGPGEVLTVPWFAEDGGEEAEIAGVYLIDPTGQPRRLGMSAGNEFADHRFERANYLNLAGSKLRTSAIGPELVLDPDFSRVPGTVTIQRGDRVVWTKAIATGEAEMCHSLANLEHHHFKFDAHRRPGDLHVHFFGAHSLSFGEGIQLEDGDEMQIRFDGFGRALRNRVVVDRAAPARVTPQPIDRRQ